MGYFFYSSDDFLFPAVQDSTVGNHLAPIHPHVTDVTPPCAVDQMRNGVIEGHEVRRVEIEGHEVRFLGDFQAADMT